MSESLSQRSARLDKIAKAIWYPDTGDGPRTLQMRRDEVERVLPAVVAEIVEALENRATSLYMDPYHIAADFIEREFGEARA